MHRYENRFECNRINILNFHDSSSHPSHSASFKEKFDWARIEICLWPFPNMIEILNHGEAVAVSEAWF